MSGGEALIMALTRAGELEALMRVHPAMSGRTLSIPLSADTPSTARDLMGETALGVVIAEGLGGRDVEILGGPEGAQCIRLGMTAEFVAAGKSDLWIALKLGCTEGRVRSLKRQLRSAAQ